MILAFDLGSTSFKSGVFEDGPTLLGAGSCSVEYVYGRNGEIELEVDAVESAFAGACRGALSEAGVGGPELRAVAVTSQAQTFTILDGGGNARMPFISWQDQRAGAAAGELSRMESLRGFGEHSSFGACLAALQVSQLRHMRRAGGATAGPGERVVNLPAYFVHRLCGRPVVDDNLAAMSGLYSLQLDAWWPPALAACALEPDRLPEVVPVGSAGARTKPDAALGLPPGLPVILAGNDQTAGAYGAQVHEGGRLLITLGTAQVAYACVDRPPPPHPDLIRGPYPGGRYYRMAADMSGGNVIRWALGILAGCASYDDFFAVAARAEPGCRGLVFDAEVPAVRGAWKGIGLQHDAGDFSRSVLEGLVDRMKGMVDALGIDPGHGPARVAGGGRRRPQWVGLLAEALGVDLEPADADPLTGAARMGLEQTERNTE